MRRVWQMVWSLWKAWGVILVPTVGVHRAQIAALPHSSLG